MLRKMLNHFDIFQKNKQKYHVRTMASTVIGELQVLKIVTHEQILLTLPSPQNDVTLIAISIFINPI